MSFVGNASSGKIHVADCPYGVSISPDQVVIFDDLSMALRGEGG